MPASEKRTVPASVVPTPEARIEQLLESAEKKDIARDFDGAIFDLTDALALEPKGELLVRVWRGLGLAYARTHDEEKAKKYLELYLPHANTKEEKILVAELLVRLGTE